MTKDQTADWQSIETAPTMKNILLFAYTDDFAGKRNWHMASGVKDHNGAWTWGGRNVSLWDYSPTHWMPLPEPPEVKGFEDEH